MHPKYNYTNEKPTKKILVQGQAAEKSNISLFLFSFVYYLIKFILKKQKRIRQNSWTNFTETKHEPKLNQDITPKVQNKVRTFKQVLESQDHVTDSDPMVTTQWPC